MPTENRTRSPRPLKVLFVTNMYPDRNNPGSGAFVHQQAEHLRKAGHEIDILHVDGKRSRTKYLTSPIEVFRRTWATRYDIVHAHYGLSGVPSLFRYSAPLVITLHGSDALVGVLQPFISRAVCSLADAVIAVSKSISARIPGKVIPCGIDLGVFTPRDRKAARARLGLQADRKLVLFPFDPARKVKRYNLAEAAVNELADPKVQLLAVSKKRNDEMPWYYSAADAMILCSRSEGSPTSVKEALACNLPVVSTDVGDVREIMAGVDGCEICEPAPGALAHGLRRVLDRGTNALVESRSRMARYDHARVAAAIEDVYQSVIHHHRNSPQR